MGQTYYLSPTGDNDLNDGLSELTPWRTLRPLWGLALDPGTAIRFQGGASFDGTGLPDDAEALLLFDAPGLTVGSYGAGRATLDAGLRRGIQCLTPGNLLIENLRILGGGGYAGVEILNYSSNSWPARNLAVSNVEASGFFLAGLVLGASSDVMEDITVTACRFSGSANGIHAGGGGTFDEPLLLRNLTITDTDCLANDGEHGGQSGCGASLNNVDGLRVLRSRFNGNGRQSVTHGHNGLMLNVCHNALVAHSEARQNGAGGAGVDGQGIVVLACRNVRVQDNDVGDNDLGGIWVASGYRNNNPANMTPCENVRIWRNTVEGDIVCLQLSGLAHDVEFAFNRVFSNRAGFSKAVDVSGHTGERCRFTANDIEAAGDSLLMEVTGGNGLRGVSFAGNRWASPTPVFRLEGTGNFSSLEDLLAAGGAA